MDYESWMKGYLTGVALHRHLRIPQLFPTVIASMSVTGIAADFAWFADLSGAVVTRVSAAYVGDVTGSYSLNNGASYSEPVPMAELLSANPGELFRGLTPAAPFLRFRFHLADDAADLTEFTLWGFSGRNP